jgi:hypothetical protein
MHSLRAIRSERVAFDAEENRMPKSWSNKRERQYEHIKKSAKSSGRSAGTAKRIAAATVNKTRRQKGETKGSSRSRRTTGTRRSPASARKRSAAARKGGRASARSRR